jgi:ATP-dependent Clp protease adapter protein ClpS
MFAVKLLLSLLSLFVVSSVDYAVVAFHPQVASITSFQRTTTSRGMHTSTSALNMAGPATVEREKTVKRTSGPAVLDSPSQERIRTPSKERNQEGGAAWEVRIYNDGMNTREHVARALVQITGMAEMTAYQTMMTAHQNGIASVGMFCFEIAEMYNEGLRKEGIVSDIVPVDEDFQ